MAFMAGIPAIIGAAASLASAGAGVYAAKMSAKAGAEQANELRVQARAEGNAAKQQEIERRRNLMRALASQSAAAGAMGIETSGSFGNLMSRDIQDNENDLLVANAGTSLRQRSLAAAASNARRTGRGNATASLLDTAGRTLQSFPTQG